MADTILFSAGNLDDLLGRLNGLQGEINAVQTTLSNTDTSASAGGDIYGSSGISLSGLAGSRISGGTVRECVQEYRQATVAYSVYFGDLSRALRQVKDLFEAVEQQQASAALGDGQESGTKDSKSTGTGTGAAVPAAGNWLSVLSDIIGKSANNWVFSTLTGPMAPIVTIISEGWKMFPSLIAGENYSSGSISELPFNLMDEHADGLNAEIAKGRVWNNNLVTWSWQEIEVFGQKVTAYLPYINYGSGVEFNTIKAGAETPDGQLGGGVDASVGTVYAGTEFEFGFEDGKFVMKIKGGFDASAASVGATEKHGYTSESVSYGVGAPGATGYIEYRDGILSGGIGGDFMEGINVDGKVDIDKGFRDLPEIWDHIQHGRILDVIRMIAG